MYANIDQSKFTTKIRPVNTELLNCEVVSIALQLICATRLRSIAVSECITGANDNPVYRLRRRTNDGELAHIDISEIFPLLRQLCGTALAGAVIERNYTELLIYIPGWSDVSEFDGIDYNRLNVLDGSQSNQLQAWNVS